MKRSLLFLVLGIVLVFSLAACGDSKDSEEPKPEDKSVVSETPPEEIEEVDEAESGSERSIEGDDTIGATTEEFRERFNENVSNRGFEFEMEDYRWNEYASGATMASFDFVDDISLTTAIADESSEGLKAILLEVDGHESRELTLDIIEALIESVSPDLSADETKDIMQKLGLTDPDRAGSIKEFEYVHGGLNYMLNDEEGNYVEFAIANENDTDFGVR